MTASALGPAMNCRPSPSCISPCIRSHRGLTGDRPVESEPLHLVNQCSALQAKFGRCAIRTAYNPATVFKHTKDCIAFHLLQNRWRWIKSDLLSLRRQWIGKDSVIGKNHG